MNVRPQIRSSRRSGQKRSAGPAHCAIQPRPGTAVRLGRAPTDSANLDDPGGDVQDQGERTQDEDRAPERREQGQTIARPARELLEVACGGRRQGQGDQGDGDLDQCRDGEEGPEVATIDGEGLIEQVAEAERAQARARLGCHRFTVHGYAEGSTCPAKMLRISVVPSG